MTKLTKKVALEAAIAALSSSELNEYRIAGTNDAFPVTEIVEKLNGMIENLDKKSGGEKKPTEQQVANVGYKSDMLNLLADGKARTATELLHEVPSFPAEMTNQRVSALLRQLIIDGKVKKEMVKGKAMFSLTEGE